ncbi:DUF2771 domain-containing protein [Streptomyces boncukensis]|uniref:DUF2771 domain-containing protein n=1 Tax=Streptomyces boncukensis TaxID=2711219 RepID=A0A6G4WW61_9ACTN|nr:DUF2771 domain-containing protein [Streptomyces boncukensis]NGO69243.1 DUF2771 domain-containing protein [Streptomyces boncukensis]
MLHPQSRRTRTLRTATALGAVSLGLLALSACEKPTPRATATVGSSTISTEASCYRDGKTIPQKEARKCLSEKTDKTISVGSGDKLRIGVEPDMAEKGWLVFVNGRPLLPDPMKKTYYSFPGEVFFQQQGAQGQMTTKKSTQISIVEADGGDFKGVWHIKLKNDDD